MPKSKYSAGLEGMRFNRTTVRVFLFQKPSGKKSNSYYWICLCDCGTWHIVNARCLFRKHTQSCGCLNRDPSTKFTKHGHARQSGTPPEFKSWEKMRKRVNDPNNEWFHRYGGRGIRYCEGFNEFADFLKVIGPRPRNKTLDRRNNDGNYSCGTCAECTANRWPLNVRWATIDEQNSNKHNTVFLTIDGRRQALLLWAKEIGMTRHSLYEQYRKSEDAALQIVRSRLQLH